MGALLEPARTRNAKWPVEDYGIDEAAPCNWGRRFSGKEAQGAVDDASRDGLLGEAGSLREKIPKLEAQAGFRKMEVAVWKGAAELAKKARASVRRARPARGRRARPTPRRRRSRRTACRNVWGLRAAAAIARKRSWPLPTSMQSCAGSCGRSSGRKAGRGGAGRHGRAWEDARSRRRPRGKRLCA